ncbi:hypothetical protein BD413DRAFT_231488 [Trametes elegans]|nr:hypothetical protein BD413DRAFT_231488 [Trametes elegans]
MRTAPLIAGNCVEKPQSICPLWDRDFTLLCFRLLSTNSLPTRTHECAGCQPHYQDITDGTFPVRWRKPPWLTSIPHTASVPAIPCIVRVTRVPRPRHCHHRACASPKKEGVSSPRIGTEPAHPQTDLDGIYVTLTTSWACPTPGPDDRLWNTSMNLYR